ncbi:unnamed protein product [Fraxinus pennsylvanica]|uniref:Uncharacterized protein n=1 Tax=Fraxinus pennsylvanica TaxID=56036 RepID=A0AAD1YVD8_9LAMI|nr:unnamed protein product [Fraxinus pennsylvanica]
MGSLVLQFEELNQYPESTSSSSKILPILEPNLEPIDEHSPLSTTPFDPNLWFDFNLISELFQNAIVDLDCSAIVPVKNTETTFKYHYADSGSSPIHSTTLLRSSSCH